MHKELAVALVLLVACGSETVDIAQEGVSSSELGEAGCRTDPADYSTTSICNVSLYFWQTPTSNYGHPNCPKQAIVEFSSGADMANVEWLGPALTTESACTSAHMELAVYSANSGGLWSPSVYTGKMHGVWGFGVCLFVYDTGYAPYTQSPYLGFTRITGRAYTRTLGPGGTLLNTNVPVRITWSPKC